MRIAVLLTCHNRRVKTQKCLISLKEAWENYNGKTIEGINLEVFLTDDGCTDGTAEAVCSIFPDNDILHVLHGNGNLFWAGGMRFCWHEAMKRHNEWDYYLLLNDDTELFPNLFEELFGAEDFIKEIYNSEGIVSGITCATDNHEKLTYGGDVWVNKFMATRKRLTPNGKPQICDLTNANILLVPTSVVDRIGIFHEGYQHGKADFDYSNTARKAGVPVVLTSRFCGSCDFDHIDDEAIARKVIGMSLKERKVYFENPVHSNHDYFLLIRRTSPIRLPLVWIGRMLNLYFPKVYYRMSGVRN